MLLASVSRRARFRVLLGLITVVLVLVLAPPGRAGAADLQANPSSLGSVFAAAQPGDVIHLAAGDYGTFAAGAKPGMVTIVADPGVAASLTARLNGASFVRFSGLTIGSAEVRSSHHVEFVGNRFVGHTLIETNANADLAIRLDANTHHGINVCSSCHEGRVTVKGFNNTTANGVVISNSSFTGGNSDGVQVVGKPFGTQIGPGNRFVDIPMIDDTHTDAIQLYGSRHTRITGNFIYRTETGIMAPDGADHETIDNNVISTLGYPLPIVLGSDQGSVVRHNTLPVTCSGCGTLRVDGGNSGRASQGTVVQDNVLGSLLLNGGSTLAYGDFNLVANGGLRGGRNLVGSPRFVGGPTSWAGYLLAPGSPGKGAASDGADMGIVPNPLAPPAAGTGTAPAGGSAGAGAAARPRVAIVSPGPGARFGKRLWLSAEAADNSGVGRVELWVDRRKRGVDTTAPYTFDVASGRRLRAGRHTIAVRAFAKDGQVASMGITAVRKRRGGGRRARSSRVRAWRVASAPGARGTLLSGDGPRRKRITVALARCGDRKGRTVQRIRSRSRRDGRIDLRRRRAGLCVVGLR